MTPHPETGYFFFKRAGRPYSLSQVEHLFSKAREAAGLGHTIPYDLRGTFAMHRAMVVKNFRQLQTEMGHGNPQSIQSYLDEASRYRVEESIFHVPDK
jgi:integrase